MSCMMSSTELLSTLARSVEYIGNGRYDTIGFELPESLARALNDCQDLYGDYDGNEIYKKLYALNAAAYNGRYKEHSTNTEAPDRPDGKRLLPLCVDYTGGHGGHFVVVPLHYDLIRALDFYIYQCDEDATRNTALLRGMKDLAGNITRFIVRNSDEYAGGTWGEV